MATCTVKAHKFKFQTKIASKLRDKTRELTCHLPFLVVLTAD